MGGGREKGGEGRERSREGSHFSFLFLLLSVPWHIHKSRVSIHDFIHLFTHSPIFTVIGRGAKTCANDGGKQN